MKKQKSHKSNENLALNPKFAEEYDQREKKKLLLKAKDMEVESESEEYSDEDSDAVLINDTVEEKFLTTIARIRANDPHLKENQEIFEDKDFEIENIERKPKEYKPTTFKTMMADKVKRKFGKYLDKNINEVSDHDSENDDMKETETDVQMQRRLKSDFLNAADDLKEGSDEEILNMVPKTKEQIQEEKDISNKFELNEKEFWGSKATKKLSEEDKFLRSYILGEKWRETNNEYDPNADEEDQDRASEIDEFEENYNFRFEERDGDKIRTYPRTIEDTYRIARNKRMYNKIAKKKRMKEFITEKKQEREQIASLRKQEIVERLKQAEEIAGIESLGTRVVKEFTTDFDPTAYDKAMAKTFGDNYYDEEDDKDKVFERTVADEYA
jgi:protein KRI1